MAKKTQELRPVMTRLPESLRRRLAREAAQNGRSMNAEIIHRLNESFIRAAVIRDLADNLLAKGSAEEISKLAQGLDKVADPIKHTRKLIEEDKS